MEEAASGDADPAMLNESSIAFDRLGAQSCYTE